jgi:predicted nucleic acid-binding protein
MECEWVLRGGYQLDAALIAASFRDLLALHNIDALESVLTQRALQGYEAGLDFADALHAAQRHDGDRFVTFDRQLVRRAPKAGVLAVELLRA